MKNKLSSFLSSKYILFALTIFCIALTVTSFFTDKFVVPVRNAVSTVVMPLQRGMNYMGLMVYDNYQKLQEMGRLLEENEQLKTQVDSLTEENNQLKQNSYELDRLRDLYELDEKYPGYDKVGARIIGTTSENWYTTFMVDKGSEDGIEKGMNVIAGGGLVGIVSDVGKNYCTIKTITDDGSYVSGMLINTGDTCTVNGDIELMDEGLIKLKYFKSGVTVRNGDKIVTSNISDLYLPGILIGYAKDIETDSNRLTQSGYLVPAVDFEHLQEVLIITEKKEVAE